MLAVAQAFEYLCEPREDFDPVVLEDWFEEAEAHALAEVGTCSSVTPDTGGNTAFYDILSVEMLQ